VEARVQALVEADNHIAYNFCNKNRSYCIQQSTIKFLKVYHQNIRGLKFKIDELLNILCPDFPHVLCLSENRMTYIQMTSITVDYYNLGAVYCRKI
jgi:hypothetical protein